MKSAEEELEYIDVDWLKVKRFYCWYKLTLTNPIMGAGNVIFYGFSRFRAGVGENPFHVALKKRQLVAFGKV